MKVHQQKSDESEKLALKLQLQDLQDQLKVKALQEFQELEAAMSQRGQNNNRVGGASSSLALPEGSATTAQADLFDITGPVKTVQNSAASTQQHNVNHGAYHGQQTFEYARNLTEGLRTERNNEINQRGGIWEMAEIANSSQPLNARPPHMHSRPVEYTTLPTAALCSTPKLRT